MYPWFPLQLEKNHETAPSFRDEARFPALGAEQCLVPNKQVRSLDLLDRTRESPPEIPHKSRSTLMSAKECEIAQCSSNQLEMMTISHALASEQCPHSHHTGKLSWLPLGNSRYPLRHPSQVYRNTNFSTGTQEISMNPISSREES